jgi:hypothetical protein
MTYKVNDTEIVNLDSQGTFANVYFQDITDSITDTTGLRVNSNTWFTANGDAKFYSLSVSTNMSTYSQAQGAVYGYDTNDPGNINRFPFSATTTNASDVGNLSVTRFQGTGQSSDSYGYTSGGFNDPPLLFFNVIDRFPFAFTANAVDVGNLTANKAILSGQSSTTHGYTAAGSTTFVPTFNTLNVIERFPFAVATTNATDVGDLTVSRSYTSGQSSTTHGYTSGGLTQPGSVAQNVIDRFPFSVTTTNATDVGDLTIAKYYVWGNSSSENGYSTSGVLGLTTTIERFPFSAATTNASDVGNLSVERYYASGQSSITHGYSSGGVNAPGAATQNIIDRFPFAATTTNASDVGDLLAANAGTVSQQY